MMRQEGVKVRRASGDSVHCSPCPEKGNGVNFSHTLDKAIGVSPSHLGTIPTPSSSSFLQAVLRRSQPIKISLTEEPANKR